MAHKHRATVPLRACMWHGAKCRPSSGLILRPLGYGEYIRGSPWLRELREVGWQAGWPEPGRGRGSNNQM